MENRTEFMPVPGKVYENIGGGTYRCLNYATYTSRMGHTEILPVMQNVCDAGNGTYWTLYAHNVRMYDNGKIDWAFSTQIGFCKYEHIEN